MRAIKWSNLILLGSGLALTISGIALLVVGSAGSPGIQALPQSRTEFLSAGEELVKQHNCNFCHRTEPPPSHAPDRANCQQCHQLHARVENLAPPLQHIAERRTEDWIRRYLRYPYAIRTGSADRMPDLQLSDLEIEVLTGYMLALAQERLAQLPETAPQRDEEPDAGRLERGKALWDRYTCGTCHSLGDHRVVAEYGPGGVPTVNAVVFSPPLDLAWTRTRPGWIAAAIKDPAKWLPWAGMVVPEISEQDAHELAWYVMNAVPTPVNTATHHDVMGVLAANCNGCHYGPREDASPATNPEGGAGWLATWTRYPRKLDLISYEGLRRGSLDDLGRPRPVVVPYAENSPLLAHLDGRKHPRMPFGLDPLRDEQVEVIRRWIMAGAPGPEVADIPTRPPLPISE